MQVPVRFVSQQHGPLPPTAILVPAQLNHVGLSEVICHLLSYDQPRSFHFLIDAHFLKSSLADYLHAHQLSSENVLVIEVIDAVPPPQPSPTAYPHPDWISDVLIDSSDTIYSACYDGYLRSLAPDHSSLIGSSALKCITMNSADIIAASLDGSLTVVSKNDFSKKSALKPHDTSVESIVAHPTLPLVVSGSFDASIHVYNLTDDPTPASSSGEGKRQRSDMSVISPQTILEGHGGAITGLAIHHTSPNMCVSASWDHTIRVWDMLSFSTTQTMSSDAPINSLALASSTIASSHTDRTVRLFDTRSPVSTSSSGTHTVLPHASVPLAVAFHPTNDHLLVTGSSDGLVRVWDTRGASPVYRVKAYDGDEEKKIIAIKCGESKVVCGGEEGIVRVFDLKNNESVGR